jgi:hypothetical protein
MWNSLNASHQSYAIEIYQITDADFRNLLQKTTLCLHILPEDDLFKPP